LITPPKKYTDFIFDDLETSKEGGSFGYLSLMFEVFSTLTKAREEKRWSQNDLAKESGLTQPVIARIESGRANPSLSQLVKLCHNLGIKIKLEPFKYGPGDYEGYLE
jgi:DNA-binding XRE family transcriptional regulator